MTALSTYLVIRGISLLVLSGFLVRYYANPKVPLFVQFLITISFALGLGGTFLLPLDISFSNSSEDDIDSNDMLTLWLFLFWSTLVLAWIVLPVTKEYLASGRFTFKSRLKEARRIVLRDVLLLLIISVICVIALAIYLRSINVMPVIIALGNTYGLIYVIVLLGDGLICVPRSLWRKTNPELELQRVRIIVRATHETLSEALLKLRQCENSIDELLDQIAGVDDAKVNAHYKYCVDQMIESRNEINNLTDHIRNWKTKQESTGKSTYGGIDGFNNELPTLNELSTLHRILKQTQEEVMSADQHWSNAVEYDKLLSNIIQLPQRSELRDQVSDTITDIPSIVKFNIHECFTRIRLVWLYKLRRLVLVFMAATATFLSFAVLLSEVTLAASWNLSPMSWLFNIGQLPCGLSVFIPLLYMSICVYRSLFKLSYVGSFDLSGSKRIDAVALAVNAQYLVRLQFSLCYNFLLMLRNDEACSFSIFMGKLALVPIFGESFSVYSPSITLAVCVFTLFNIHAKFLSMFGIENEESVLLAYKKGVLFLKEEGDALNEEKTTVIETNKCTIRETT